MADRVHPADSPPAAAAGEAQHRPKAGTYVIQIPKDQIYRVPPPENADLFESYRRRGARRRSASPCCRCLVWTLAALLAILVAAASAAAVLYLVIQPKLPSYSLDRISVGGLNLSAAAAGPAMSPEFDVTVRADNPNGKIGIYYDAGSDVGVYYSGVGLCRGSWPEFYQGHRNVTVFVAKLRGSGVRLSSPLLRELGGQQRKGQVPLEIDVKVPVRVKVGAVTSWAVTVKVRCDVVVDKLASDSRIVSKDCRTELDI